MNGRTNSNYFVRMDGVRAIAVAAVMIQHWNTELVAGLPLSPASAGVEFFFVLSGFLIGGILMRADDQAARIGYQRRRILIAFVIRRALRIFPAYFVYLFLTAVFLGPPDRAGWPWYALYAGNIRIPQLGHWPGQWGHLWSLAVEEQFYLVAPLLILVIPTSWRSRAVIGLIASAVVADLIYRANGIHLMVPPASFFGLGCGFGLAHISSLISPQFKRVLVAFAGTALFLLLLVPSDLHLVDFATQASITGLATLLVLDCVHGNSKPFAFLAFAPLVWIGKRAYGLYLWHNSMPAAFARAGVDFSAQPILRVFLLVAATFVMAEVSWRVVERPINSLKSRFPYIVVPAAATVETLPEPVPA
ncbi:MAG: acyltransferase [Acidimicrobiales bacterium]|nr:acyltransferase [Acidimicrobiales bacterium]